MKMEGGRNDEISEGGGNEKVRADLQENAAKGDLHEATLHEAAAKGDWGKAEEIFKRNPQYVGDEHSDVQDTALEAAVLAGHSGFVKKLLRSCYRKKEDLERKNCHGNTAFILAAKLGNIEVVLMMLEKNKDLVNIRDKKERLPVQMAAFLGYKDMVKCLYFRTMAQFNEDDLKVLRDDLILLRDDLIQLRDDLILLLLTLIENDIYDVALLMVKEFPTLAVSRKKVHAQKTNGNGENKDEMEENTDGNGEKKDEMEENADGNGETKDEIEENTDGNGENKDGNGENTDGNGEKKDEMGETALHALARKPLKTLNEIGNSKQGILKRFYYRFIGSIMMEKKKMDPEAHKLLKVLWENIVKLLDYKQISELIEKPSTLISDAAKEGNIEFISILIFNQPNAILNVNDNGHTLFHTAVEYRQDKIFKLIYEKPSIKKVIVSLTVGKEENTILHLAAKLPPDQNRLKVVSGAALQMQRELWWFKEVRKLMPPRIAGAKNRQEAGKTARTLFTESHEKLMKKGEEWMKKTAESCMIVATLIATIVFAAAFTVPGGVKDDTGAPHFLRKASFKWFAIFDIISLVSSSCSILTFLSILTARYALEDFGWSLPIKLLLGLFTLFISIIAMMVVFCTTLFIIFDGGTKVLAYLAIALASIPVITFILQQIRLFFDVVRLMSFSLGKPKKSSALLRGSN